MNSLKKKWISVDGDEGEEIGLRKGHTHHQDKDECSHRAYLADDLVLDQHGIEKQGFQHQQHKREDMLQYCRVTQQAVEQVTD